MPACERKPGKPVRTAFELFATVEISVRARPHRRQSTASISNRTCLQARFEWLFFLYPPSGPYYFEAVEFLPDLERHHHQNYIAPCPIHAAMFMHTNNSKDEIKNLFLTLDGNDLELTLANQTVSLYFTGCISLT